MTCSTSAHNKRAGTQQYPLLRSRAVAASICLRAEDIQNSAQPNETSGALSRPQSPAQHCHASPGHLTHCGAPGGPRSHCRRTVAPPAPTGHRGQRSRISLRSGPGQGTHCRTWAPGQPHRTGDAAHVGKPRQQEGQETPATQALFLGTLSQ